jgi:rhodanese-related sulfurtransferase
MPHSIRPVVNDSVWRVDGLSDSRSDKTNLPQKKPTINKTLLSMFDSIKQLFGMGPSADFANLVQNGAVIIDVRTPGEYASGHIRGSVNIPLDRLQNNLSKLNKEKPIITCCASGMRSASAKSVLQAAGYTAVYNGGGWSGLQRQLHK